jgi:hypothetical protein
VTREHYHALERKARWHVKFHPKGVKRFYYRPQSHLSYHSSWIVGNEYSPGIPGLVDQLNILRNAYGLDSLGEITLADGTPLSAIRNLATLAAAS